jgi:hypothetical protein
MEPQHAWRRSRKAEAQGAAEGSRSREAAGRGGRATAASSEEREKRMCLTCGVKEGAAVPERDVPVRLKLCGQCRKVRGAWALLPSLWYPLLLLNLPAHQSRPLVAQLI